MVGKVRDYLDNQNFAIKDLQYEADDPIADRARGTCRRKML